MQGMSQGPGAGDGGIKRDWPPLSAGAQLAGEPPGWLLLAVVALVAASAAYLLNDPGSRRILIVPGGAVGLFLAWRAWLFTTNHQEWLVPALMLVLLAISCAFLGGTLRAGVHYGLATLICLPAAPAVWSSGILRREGFKLYAMYFVWALITVAYSIAPLFSISRLLMSVLIFLAVCLAVTKAVTKIENAEDVRRMFGRIVAVSGALVLANFAALFILRGGAWQVSLDDQGLPTDKGLDAGGLLRFAGIMDNPNMIGLLMLITVTSALICLPYSKGRQRHALIALSLAAIAIAALADSRSSFVALGAGVTLYVLWRYRARALLAMAVVLVAAVVAMPLLGPNTMDYLTRGDVTTLTGRTDMWQFVIREIAERPLAGYGYEVAGQIFKSRYFPIWWGPWDLGPQSSLHNGFLDRAIGMGIPATLFWLFIVLRPWFALSRQNQDVFDLKPLFTLLVVPLLIYNLTESTIADFSDASGLRFGLAWAMAEMQRLRWLEKTAAERLAEQTRGGPAVVALRSLAGRA